jgi:drug/metabolite transporter (DMT)-like permease
VIGCLLISSQDVLPWVSGLFDKMKSGHLQSIWLELITEKSMLGYLLTFVAIVSWGSSTVFGKKLTSQGYNEEQIMGGRFTFGFIFLAFYAWSNKQLLHFDWQALVWGKILAMVLISGLFGMYFYYKGLKNISAHVCALAEMFFPLSAVMINWIFLGAKLTIIQIVGAGLLTLSSAVIQIKQY